MTPKEDVELQQLLDEAAKLQQLVPDMVLVGGSVAAFYAAHRISRDHDHVLADLKQRFSAVLDALEAEPDWVVNQVTPGKIILGVHNQIEYGIRQMIRTRPLEVVDETLVSGATIRVPTIEEALRIKAFLLVRRNVLRDFIDVAALASEVGLTVAATVLERIDYYYRDPSQPEDAVATQLIKMLANPLPGDQVQLPKLIRNRLLKPEWQDWYAVRAILAELACLMRPEWC